MNPWYCTSKGTEAGAVSFHPQKGIRHWLPWQCSQGLLNLAQEPKTSEASARCWALSENHAGAILSADWT